MKEETKQFLWGLLIIGVFIFFVKQIKVTDTEPGENYGYDVSWSEAVDKMVILENVPTLTGVVDYWKIGRAENPKRSTAYLGYKEVDKPAKLADEIKEKLLAAGFEEVKIDHTIDRDSNNYKEDTLKIKYYDFEKDLSGDDIKTLYVTVEYFDYQYEDSHNVFVTVSPTH